MPRKDAAGLTRMVNLFKSGMTASDIALRMGISRQAVSVRLRAYYKANPDKKVSVNVTRTCIVCGTQETITREMIPIASLRPLRAKDIEEQEKFICPMCKDNKLHLCTSCGSVGYLGTAQFPPTPRRGPNQRAHCRKCNKESVIIWRNKNIESARRIYREYIQRVRGERRRRGVCTSCGSPVTGEFKTCEDCRRKDRQTSALPYPRKDPTS